LRGFGVASSDAATEEQQRDAGTEWTMECAARYGRPLLVCDVDDADAKEKIQQWLDSGEFRTLNVAGPSESVAPGIGDRAYALLRSLFEDL
jgi:hypothetical protein